MHGTLFALDRIESKPELERLLREKTTLCFVTDMSCQIYAIQR